VDTIPCDKETQNSLKCEVIVHPGVPSRIEDIPIPIALIKQMVQEVQTRKGKETWEKTKYTRNENKPNRKKNMYTKEKQEKKQGINNTYPMLLLTDNMSRMQTTGSVRN
jgi:hypothetical protein